MKQDGFSFGMMIFEAFARADNSLTDDDWVEEAAAAVLEFQA